MTCGNGYDTEFLAGISEKVIAVDIQIDALENTQNRCAMHQNIDYKHMSHDLLTLSEPVDGLIYNLGYLPGSDKSIITRANSTVESLKNCLPMVTKFIAISCYRKHDGGNEEYHAVKDYVEATFKNVKTLEYETKLSPVTFLIEIESI